MKTKEKQYTFDEDDYLVELGMKMKKLKGYKENFKTIHKCCKCKTNHSIANVEGKPYCIECCKELIDKLDTLKTE